VGSGRRNREGWQVRFEGWNIRQTSTSFRQFVGGVIGGVASVSGYVSEEESGRAAANERDEEEQDVTIFHSPTTSGVQRSPMG
jgi:hypothetical protein